jgi:hypothetical protein
MSLKMLQAFRQNPRLFIERFFLIRDKDRRTAPLHFNSAQDDYYRHRTLRDLILKARQMGFTTLICALFLADCLLRENTHAVVVAHTAESAEAIFEIVRFMWRNLPAWWHQNHPATRESSTELFWETLNSRFSVGTAGSQNFGRSQTINNLLCSEVAHWRKPQEALTSLLAAVPASGCVVLESTPNGVGNYFYDLWQAASRGESAFTPQFYVWWEDPSYRIAGPPLGPLTKEERDLQERYRLTEDQLRWRREKQRELREKFAQEYPEDPERCFLTTGGGCFSRGALLDMRTQASQWPGRTIQQPIPYCIWYQTGKQQAGLVNPLPGRLTIWKEAEEGHQYVIGADVAAGLESGNYSAAVLLDQETGEQMAEFHGRPRPDLLAHVLSGLAARYRMPWLAVESNNHGGTTLYVLRSQLHYPRLHYYFDRLRGGKRELGWPTNSRTKPLMIDGLAAAIADRQILIRSPWLIDECLTFVSRDGELGAEEGKYDDLVIAAAIAWQIRLVPRSRGSTVRPPGW